MDAFHEKEMKNKDIIFEQLDSFISENETLKND